MRCDVRRIKQIHARECETKLVQWYCDILNDSDELLLLCANSHRLGWKSRNQETNILMSLLLIRLFRDDYVLSYCWCFFFFIIIFFFFFSCRYRFAVAGLSSVRRCGSFPKVKNHKKRISCTTTVNSTLRQNSDAHSELSRNWTDAFNSVRTYIK